jgi:hypothetical protein
MYIPSLGGTAAARDQYGRIRVYTCPSYPNKRQVVCYVVNSWQFSNPRDMVGSEVTGAVNLQRVQSPSETIYFADNESASWRPVFTVTNVIGGVDLNDVWNPAHLPYGATGRTLSGERRVAAWWDWFLTAPARGCSVVPTPWQRADRRTSGGICEIWKRARSSAPMVLTRPLATLRWRRFLTDTDYKSCMRTVDC